MSDRNAPTYEYLVSGRNGRGRRVTEIITASTADDAVRDFEDHGHTETVLHTDDLVAVFFKPSTMRKQFRPREIVRLRTTGPLAFAGILALALYRQIWYLQLLAAGVLVYFRWADEPWGFWDALGIGFLFFPFLLAAYRTLSGSYRTARRILVAVGWARWEEVLQLIHRRKLSLVPVEVRLRKAQALAGLGRLSEALAEFDPVADMADVPEYVYWAFQAMIFAAGKEPERVITVMLRAHELAPNSGTVLLIDLANKMLVVRRDRRRARELLAEAKRHAIADTAMPWLMATEGLMELQDGRPAEAAEWLSDALRRMHPFLRGNPSVISLGARIRAWLCLARAAVGDTTKARKLLRQAGPLLVAHQEHDLLRQCEQAVG